MQRIGSIGSRPCENVRERRNHRIVFSIAFFGQPPSGLLVLRLKKSRRTFYAQIERGSFRTASVDCCRNPEVGALAAFSALRWSPFRPFCAVARGQLGLRLGNVASQVARTFGTSARPCELEPRAAVPRGFKDAPCFHHRLYRDAHRDIAGLYDRSAGGRLAPYTGAAAGDDRDSTLLSRAPVAFCHRQ